jgi:hypothetical protein
MYCCGSVKQVFNHVFIVFVGDDEELEHGNETASTTNPTSEPSESVVEPLTCSQCTFSNSPSAAHKASITDDIIFYDQFTKQELLDQYSKSEICLPLAYRERLENNFRHLLELQNEQNDRDFHEQHLSSSTTQIEQLDEKNRATDVPPMIERSNSCKSVVKHRLIM